MRQITTFLLSILSVLVWAQGEWELKKEEDGIKVYTKYVDNSDIKAYKAEAVLEGKLSSFIAVLKDVNAYNDLFDSADHVELIEETDTFHMHYLQTKVPWPISDRDGVYTNTYRQHYGTKAVTIDIASVDGVRPEEDGYVRIKDMKGYWLFYPVSNNAVEVTYEVHADPGGNVPSWVINMFLVDTPLSDIKNLQEQARLPKYANRKFDFLVDN